MESKRPQIGVGVIVTQENKVLLGKRKNAHGEGAWSFPGGHLEFGESVLECTARELQEETGLIVKDATVGPYTNDIFEEEGKHYITLFMIVTEFSGELIVREPHKCEKWEWFSWDALPEPLFIPVHNLRKKGFSPFV